MDLKCKHAAELLSDSMHHKLTRYQRWSLRLHLLICTACRRLRRQFQLIRNAMREDDLVPSEPMPDAMRRRIAVALRHRAET